MRRQHTAEERLANSLAVGKLVAIAQRFLDQEIDRQTAASETDALHLGYYTKDRPRLSGAANSLHDLLVSLTEGAEEPVVRDIDIADALDTVLTGEVSIAPTELLVLSLPLATVAERTLTVPLRYWLEGIGFLETLKFGSWATGRAYLAHAHLDPDRPTGTTILSWGVPTTLGEQRAVIADLFDTLGIDLEQVSHPQGLMMPTWDVMRLDDNGNEFIVETYSGYRRALNRVDELERHKHKQSYWVRPSDPGVHGPNRG